jgi:hypothetical protein
VLISIKSHKRKPLIFWWCQWAGTCWSELGCGRWVAVGTGSSCESGSFAVRSWHRIELQSQALARVDCAGLRNRIVFMRLRYNWNSGKKIEMMKWMIG